ncbi:kinase-like domain-containing protein [Rhizophagus clarus]|uniref:Kinase-like domain-containing protein n=1 Tax=Rhizophagus clarus TaxID=94130 RepID=A0A8H3KN81_9GLOM|nr:kinase-like domain-containing protein [Rhizophagus clarus]
MLNNSPCLNDKFLDEWKYHYDCQKKSFSKFIQIFGITQDPINLDYIIVMRLCKPISELQDSDEKDNEIYGVLPFMAPEILGYSPFNHEAHDLQLSVIICEGGRPEIKKNTPKCYVDLMKKCWDSNPSNRPTITEHEYEISEWIRCISEYYEINKDGGNYIVMPNLNNELKNDMLEFVEANNALVQEEANVPIIQSHPQAYYASRKLTECLDCKI